MHLSSCLLHYKLTILRGEHNYNIHPYYVIFLFPTQFISLGPNCFQLATYFLFLGYEIMPHTHTAQWGEEIVSNILSFCALKRTPKFFWWILADISWTNSFSIWLSIFFFLVIHGTPEHLKELALYYSNYFQPAIHGQGSPCASTLSSVYLFFNSSLVPLSYISYTCKDFTLTDRE